MISELYGVIEAASGGLRQIHQDLESSTGVREAVQQAEARYKELKASLSPEAQAVLEKGKEQALAEGVGLPKSLALLYFFLKNSARLLASPIQVGVLFSEVSTRTYKDGREVECLTRMNPNGTYARIPKNTKSVGPFTHIDPGAELGENGKIGDLCFIDKGVVLGNGFRLSDKVDIYWNTKIGNDFVGGYGIRIGCDFVAGDNFIGEDYLRGGDGATCGSNIHFPPYGNIGNFAVIRNNNHFPTSPFKVENNQEITENQYPSVAA